MITVHGADAGVDQLVAALPCQRWKRISGGAGAHGERIYDWARVAIRPYRENGFGGVAPVWWTRTGLRATPQIG